MKTLRILAMVATLGMVVSADGVPTVVTYVPNSKVTEVMTKGGEIVNDKGLIILANRRGSGEVEVHDKTNHIFIIVEGEATFVTGGTPGWRQEHRARSDSGGEPQRRPDAPVEKGRRHHRSGEDAALVERSLDQDDRVLRDQHRALRTRTKDQGPVLLDRLLRDVIEDEDRHRALL